MADTSHTAPTAANGTYWRERLQHVSWGSIILGLVIAIAVQILLWLLGMGIGLTTVDPTDPMGGLGAWGIGTAIYMVITQIISLFIGGYVAARLAPALTSQSAIFHGAAIWALALIITVWLGAVTTSSAVGGVSSAVSGMASATTQGVKAVLPENIGLPDLDFAALPEPVQETLRENNITPEDLGNELRNAYREVVSGQQEQQVMNELRQAVTNILQNPTEAPEEIDQTIDDIFAEGGILSQEDLDEMQNTLQQRLNLSDQDVEQITDQVQQTVEETRSSVKEAVASARKEAADTAEAITDTVGSMALWMFFASVLGLIAAIFGGKVGETLSPVVR